MAQQAPLSVVVISRNEGTQLRRTVENLEDTLPPGAEIAIVDDGSEDGSADFLARRRGRVRLYRGRGLGVARARNFGASRTTADLVVFADAHIRTRRDWWRPLLELTADPRTGAAAPAITDTKPGQQTGYGLTFKDAGLNVEWIRARPAQPAAAPILPGCCFAIRRHVLEHSGGWDSGLLNRGNVDNEYCLRLWLMGYELKVTPEVVVKHLFRSESPYHVNWPEYLFNRLRLAFVHLGPSRLGKVVGELRKYPGFGEALTLVADSDLAGRRREVAARRVSDDNWFFHRFGGPL
jgi:GT2 family glycosyltransferase